MYKSKTLLRYIWVEGFEEGQQERDAKIRMSKQFVQIELSFLFLEVLWSCNLNNMLTRR